LFAQYSSQLKTCNSGYPLLKHLNSNTTLYVASIVGVIYMGEV
jgi:hypothetical protein